MTPLAPAYFGTAGRLALLWAAQGAVDPLLRYDKRQKCTHSCLVADVNGPLRLTMPVSRPPGARLWSEVLISPHDNWPAKHVTALESAYGRTPWCEYFLPWIADVLRAAPGRTLAEVTAALDAAMLRLLPPPPPGFAFAAPERVLAAAPAPYRQVRAEALGFIPGLSAVDLLMNLGPETAFSLMTLG